MHDYEPVSTNEEVEAYDNGDSTPLSNIYIT
jgi:hypothetical protein